MARPPALCAHCGHDVARGASRCGQCSREMVPWVLARRGEIVDVSAWFTVPLGIALAVLGILVRDDHPQRQVWIGMLLVGALVLLAVVVFVGEAHWTSSVGATARTFHGRLAAAAGTCPETIVHTAPGQSAVRGDVLYDVGGNHRDGWPDPFGGNPVEISLVAALIGAVARGHIALVETRPRRWKRVGAARTESPQGHGGTFEITLVSRPHGGEDAIADLLLGPLYPPIVDDYRGGSDRAAGDGLLAPAARRSVALADLVRQAFPPAHKPGRTMRRRLPHVARDPEERAAIVALLETVSRDARGQTWLSLRDALRRAFALRNKPVG